MPIKDPDLRRQNHAKYMREVWYPKNKDSHKAAVKSSRPARKKRLLEFINTLKEASGCVDCGTKDHRILDFDHVVGSKVISICKARCNGQTEDSILNEIEKCEVRCANCHRIKTYERRCGAAE